jgi:SecD/SecF fusion protein
MLIYISLRFRNLRLGAAAILSTLHDVLVMIVFYSILRIPINYSFIAALLTILGYSINATIVIFDRVRENRTLMRRAPFLELLDTSITQTMRRSIFTLITVFIVLLALYILGVASIREFTLPIMIGVVAGGFSSICLACSFLYVFSPKPQAATGTVTAKPQAAQQRPAVSAAAPVTASSAKQTAPVESNQERQLRSTPRRKSKRR